MIVLYISVLWKNLARQKKLIVVFFKLEVNDAFIYCTELLVELLTKLGRLGVTLGARGFPSEIVGRERVGARESKSERKTSGNFLRLIFCCTNQETGQLESDDSFV